MKIKYETTKAGIKIGCRYDPTINYNNPDQYWVRIIYRPYWASYDFRFKPIDLL